MITNDHKFMLWYDHYDVMIINHNNVMISYKIYYM